MQHLSLRKRDALPVGALAASLAAAAAGATAAWVEFKSRRAAQDHPPAGKFIHMDGVRLHYVMRGDGPPVLLIHGNTLHQADFQASGLIDRLARDHTVIAFDRPGFGHSSRPRDRVWTPAAQAALLRRALAGLGIHRPMVVGHSMGATVALCMALDYPVDVRGLVLIGGYYYPTLRLDALMMEPVALPVLGDAMRYTVTALTARAALGRAVEGIFAPRPVPAGFYPALSRELMLRPLQLRANAEDATHMVPQARALASRYRALHVPMTLIAGAQDKVVDLDAARRLQSEVGRSRLHVIPKTGHMAHYEAQDLIVQAVRSGSNLPLGDGVTAPSEPLSQAGLLAGKVQPAPTGPGRS